MNYNNLNFLNGQTSVFYYIVTPKLHVKKLMITRTRINIQRLANTKRYNLRGQTQKGVKR